MTTTRVPYRDTWPATAAMLWRIRHREHELAGYRVRFCCSCGHAYAPGYFRDHLRAQAHADQRGWWRRG